MDWLKVSKRAADIPPFLVVDVIDRMAELTRQGADCVSLMVGDPDFDTPPCIVEAANRALADCRTHYTHSLGIIELTAMVPFAPGNINNASTFDFPVRYESLGDIDPMWVVAAEPHPKVLERAVAAARKLERHGCRAILGNCGFFGNYQKQVAAEITVPFFGSSLLQIPMVLSTLGRDQKVGVLTADGSKLEVAPALEDCGVTSRDRVVIYGVENEPEAVNILNTTGHLNLEALEQDLVNIARRMLSDHPDIGSIVLECTEFPPHAHANPRRCA